MSKRRQSTHRDRRLALVALAAVAAIAAALSVTAGAPARTSSRSSTRRRRSSSTRSREGACCPRTIQRFGDRLDQLRGEVATPAQPAGDRPGRARTRQGRAEAATRLGSCVLRARLKRSLSVLRAAAGRDLRVRASPTR